MTTIQTIEAELNAAIKLYTDYNRIHNEGGEGYNPHQDTIDELSKKLAEAKNNVLLSNLDAEKAWFNAQRFTAADLARADRACLARGYSLADLQAACKAARA